MCLQELREEMRSTVQQVEHFRSSLESFRQQQQQPALDAPLTKADIERERQQLEMMRGTLTKSFDSVDKLRYVHTLSTWPVVKLRRKNLNNNLKIDVRRKYILH